MAGAFSAIVKLSWEAPFPPRTPERDATNPPQRMLELWFGMSPEQSHALVFFNGNPRPIYSLIVDFAFSIVIALFYCIVAECFPTHQAVAGCRFRLSGMELLPRVADAYHWSGPSPVPVDGGRPGLG
ncbi:DUF1440 domain-containing protein [Tessaracoccus sp. OH4464_COT-324]|uniref:DUF1440 domain-containing protein n=1 Tax=Tessaracoccus sp. OH4464_COT-324 TaxID=2491059 RepID=UPI0021019D9A|nr:DUF1440 domain-containing protein [Tessaracoccus sp. OH4464_COT-324]